MQIGPTAPVIPRCQGVPHSVQSRFFGGPGQTPGRPKTESLMKTFSAKPSEVERDWYLVDASGKTLGRLASEIARRLRGKHKPEYTPHVDTGDYIVVVNADKVRVSGRKETDKYYHRWTGYVGNLKSESLSKLRSRAPERILKYAVKGMLPSNPLGRSMFRKLKVYRGPDHRHQAQQPRPLDI